MSEDKDRSVSSCQHKKSKNRSLHKAKKVKYDEFYTRFEDIENELKHFKDCFKDKVVLCNCDDFRKSNFPKYFLDNFKLLGLQKLITSCINKDGKSFGVEYTSPNDVVIHYFNGDGDFRSNEVIELLKQADIVVTNPPFSLFREFVAQLMEYEKQFLIIGSQNAIVYKEIFPLFIKNKMWLGYPFKGSAKFYVPDNAIMNGYCKGFFNSATRLASFGNCCWFTNLYVPRRYEKLELNCKYDESKYPKYDNYDAIEVGKVVNIPIDYDGAMGVPVSFLNKYNPEQFEILGEAKHGSDSEYDLFEPFVNNRLCYTRIIIKHRCFRK